ncbi:hypothetical protein J2X63_000470 [Agromyces sp. 3263]|uniref:hypothetical protein n=1 Tax=Agromyces sp. 3263 TaxID=2817750 RepID=UPI002861CE2D|nr:hypothetical protein [Agromyces sp. 3263]MDR6904784.1 hypothetical protein [Agromyces sp. 3263]
MDPIAITIVAVVAAWVAVAVIVALLIGRVVRRADAQEGGVREPGLAAASPNANGHDRGPVLH